MRIDATGTLEHERAEYGEELAITLAIHPVTPFEHEVLAELLDQDLGPTVKNISEGNVLKLELLLPPPAPAAVSDFDFTDLTDDELEQAAHSAIATIRSVREVQKRRKPGMLERVLGKLPHAGSAPPQTNS